MKKKDLLFIDEVIETIIYKQVKEWGKKDKISILLDKIDGYRITNDGFIVNYHTTYQPAYNVTTTISFNDFYKQLNKYKKTSIKDFFKGLIV